MNKKRILLFCNGELPNSYANATRTLALAKTMKENGNSVFLWGVSYKNNVNFDGEYEGLPYTNIKCPNNLKKTQALTRNKYLKKRISDKLQDINGSLDAIVLSGVGSKLAKPFLKFSKKTNTPLIVNAVEWYDPRNEMFLGLAGKIRFIRDRYSLICLFVKMHNIIAISSLLGNYYKKKGCNVCIIPTIVDIDDYKNEKYKIKEKLQIAYAGSPAKKDYVINVIKAILLLSKQEKKKLEMHLYGITVEEAMHLGLEESEIEQIKECVFFHGRIPQEQVKKKISQADFTVLLRPNKKYANAGFPTKVGESMACGTPVIANITSDLGKYIIDGKTGIVCEDERTENCLKAIRKALSLSIEEKSDMRKNTFEMAKISFDYKNYIDTIQKFLDNTYRQG